MTISERIETMSDIFDDIAGAQGLNAKRQIIDEIPMELRDDFDFCIEVLQGKHKLGYKYEEVDSNVLPPEYLVTIKDVIKYLQKPLLEEHDLSYANRYLYCARTAIWSDFLEPLCNRKYRLGIGSSILEKSSIAPMLAKKFEGSLNYGDFYVTEKLDGNRCIAFYEDEEWHFVSRNGKRMNVEFDMSGLPEELVYDGEVVAPQNVELSRAIYEKICKGTDSRFVNTDFNSTSGLINSKGTKKSLVYCIFDVQENSPYIVRRSLLGKLTPKASNVMILPLLGMVNKGDESVLGEWLDIIVNLGGEGLMINFGGSCYENKRTSALLKYKQVQTMDMRVTGITDGTGKYYRMVGALECEASNGGLNYSCSVGSGLSDVQRLDWAKNPEHIIGKLVEVSYFSLSQNQSTKLTGQFSLRFPRLKRVRTDKNESSIY